LFSIAFGPARLHAALGGTAMHYVIHLNLGSEAEEQVRSLWRLLADQGISPRELASDGTPHVTVMSSAPFPLAGVTKDLASLAGEFEPFEVTFSHLGIFSGHPAVLFLGVTHTAVLTSLHRRLYDLVSPAAEVFEFARPDVFVFHCSLGYILRPPDLPRAVELALRASLPRKVRVTGFDVVECGETTSRSLASYAFSE
jgi:2'-5' RNA ligase